MNKRALSPLAATILLVAFALVIGIVTMHVGRSYVEEEDGEVKEELKPFESSVIININDILGDELKELQIKYITGKITREEYLEKEQEIVRE